MKRSNKRSSNKPETAATKTTRGTPPPAKRVAAPMVPATTEVESEILTRLREAGQPLTLEQLLASNKRSGKTAAAKLQRELAELERTGEVVRNRRDEYCLRERIGLVV